MLREAGRELARRSTLGLLAGYAFSAAVWALVAVEERMFYWNIVHLLAPLFVAPVAARAVARDREGGMTEALALTRLTRGEWLAGKCLFVLAFVAAAVALTVPSSYALASGAGPDGPLRHAEFFAWSALLGLCAGAWGLLVAAMAGTRAVAALTLGFGLVFVWLGLGIAAEDLVELASGPSSWAVLTTLVHLSPLTWAFDAVGVTVHRQVLGAPSPPAVYGALLLLITPVVLLPIVTLRLQHVKGWLDAPPARAAAAALAVSAVAVLALASWTHGADETVTGEAIRTRDGEIRMTLSVTRPPSMAARALGGFEDGQRVLAHFSVSGPEGRVIELSALRLRSDHYEYALDDTLPKTFRIADAGPPAGTGSVFVNFTARVKSAAMFAPVYGELVVDGEAYVLRGEALGSRPQGGEVAGAAWAFAEALVFGTLAWRVPRGLNRW